MSATNVKSYWSGGDLYFADKSGNTIAQLDGTNRKLVIPSGSTLDVPAGQVDRGDLVEDALVAAVPINILKVDGSTLAAAEAAGTFNIAVGTNTLLVQGEVTDNETEVSVATPW